MGRRSALRATLNGMADEPFETGGETVAGGPEPPAAPPWVEQFERGWAERLAQLPDEIDQRLERPSWRASSSTSGCWSITVSV